VSKSLQRKKRGSRESLGSGKIERRIMQGGGSHSYEGGGEGRGQEGFNKEEGL